jgi:hypothetical protein
MQGVYELDVAVAAQAEGVGHLLADQVIDDDLSAIEPIVGGSFEHRVTSLVGQIGAGAASVMPAKADIQYMQTCFDL